MSSPRLGAVVARRYDSMFRSFHHESFFGGSGYSNFGLWDAETEGGKEASDNLVAALVALGRTLESRASREERGLERSEDRGIPATTRPTSAARSRPENMDDAAPARVLDVACGAGGTTRWLAEHLPDARLTAINLSEAQLEGARRRVPEAEFRYMDGAQLEFVDASFDWVVCVEAAFHFDTRRRFLAEAARVLRPGGLLLVTDLVTRQSSVNAWRQRLGLPLSVPMTNEVTSAAQYQALVEEAGFARVAVRSERERTLVPFGKRFLASCVKNAVRPRTWPALARDPITVPTFALWYAYNRMRISDYLLVAARR